MTRTPDRNDRTDRLSDEERDRMLAVIERFANDSPIRSQAEVDAEIAEIRETRRLSAEHRRQALGE